MRAMIHSLRLNPLARISIKRLIAQRTQPSLQNHLHTKISFAFQARCRSFAHRQQARPGSPAAPSRCAYLAQCSLFHLVLLVTTLMSSPARTRWQSHLIVNQTVRLLDRGLTLSTFVQRGAVRVEARRTVKGASSSPDSVWYGPGKLKDQ